MNTNLRFRPRMIFVEMVLAVLWYFVAQPAARWVCALFLVLGVVLDAGTYMRKAGRKERLKLYGIDGLSASSDEEVRRVLQAGDKLLAIKLYRELHRSSLREALDAVTAMEAPAGSGS